MRKKVTKTIIATLVTMLLACIALAATQLWFHQQLSVPEGSIKLYQENQVTEIASGSDQKAIWTWYSATRSFNATIWVYNDGASTVNVEITYSGLAAGWTFKSTGDTSKIEAGAWRQVSLSVSNQNAMAGDVTGDFTITTSIV